MEYNPKYISTDKPPDHYWNLGKATKKIIRTIISNKTSKKDNEEHREYAKQMIKPFFKTILKEGAKD